MGKVFKFLAYFFIIFIFLAAGIFLMREFIGPVDSTVDQTAFEGDFPAVNQKHLIVFLVDEINEKKPQLISVFAVNLFIEEPRQITFLPLTFKTDEDYEKLSKQFHIKDNAVTEGTIKAFEKHFDTSWNGVILLDKNAVDYFTLSFLGTNPQLENTENFMPKLNAICQQLNEVSENPLYGFIWKQILNIDFFTTFGFGELQTTVEAMSENPPPKCQIIGIDY